MRIVALALVPILIGATWPMPATAGSSPQNGGWEYPAFWTVTLLVQALLGNSAFAFTPNAAPRLQRA